MIRRVGLVAAVLVLLAGAIARGEWVMKLHSEGVTEVFAVSTVDSMTFEYVEELPMVLVPAGVFTMGDGSAYCGDDEREITLTRAFYIGLHEVTNQEYMDALQWAYDHGYVSASDSTVVDNMEANGYQLVDLNDEDCEIAFAAGVFSLCEATSADALAAYPGGYDPANHPVKEISWYGCARFCDWLSLRHGFQRAYTSWSCNGGDPYGAQGYRLLTDAEFEYAAQFNDERIWPWGSEDWNSSLGNTESVIGWTTPVGSYPAAPESLGLFDMGGNIWERCNDYYEDCHLGTTPETDPVGPTGPGWRHVTRGGCYGSYDSSLKCAARGDYRDSNTDAWLGFRIARTAGGP